MLLHCFTSTAFFSNAQTVPTSYINDPSSLLQPWPVPRRRAKLEVQVFSRGSSTSTPLTSRLRNNNLPWLPSLSYCQHKLSKTTLWFEENKTKWKWYNWILFFNWESSAANLLAVRKKAPDWGTLSLKVKSATTGKHSHDTNLNCGLCCMYG